MNQAFLNYHNLTLNTRGLVLRKERGEKLLKKLETLCNSLHTTLDLNPSIDFWIYVSYILTPLSLARLGSIIRHQKKQNTTIAFWENHPALEYT